MDAFVNRLGSLGRRPIRGVAASGDVTCNSTQQAPGGPFYLPCSPLLQGSRTLHVPPELGPKVSLLRENVEYVLFRSQQKSHYCGLNRPENCYFCVAAEVQVFESNWAQATNRRSHFLPGRKDPSHMCYPWMQQKVTHPEQSTGWAERPEQGATSE